jgi:hypothetical protein
LDKETYEERMKNEERIDNSDILRMSDLTISLLRNIDYLNVSSKRKKNFYFAHELFKNINKIDPTLYIDNNCIPMVYPLVIERLDLTDKLKKNQIYTGRWWNYVLSEVTGNTFETWLTRFMAPLPIDQRYDEKTLRYILDVVIND